ncbi:condensin-2 complex subunit H2 isoform X1 [Elaeis guineensis]|uniref:Condensin-2 complex subunit H2 n=1 Tax=Elaeis guineensis var. tenera TaxID=51953 RepID=A0A6I9RQA0_ELAGV|nr:condensin-2 complex subunit H2 isoform X1 [Elaeis guineensis]
MDDREELPGTSEAGGARFHVLQPNRDLQSNWEVDLAKNLEEYLLKICSGEISSDQDHALHSVNFAEAALLVQGSVQVYSRKVEYLYSLVLHALEFLSLKRQSQQENASILPDGSESGAVIDEGNEIFLGLDDVPVEAKNCLDGGLEKADTSKHFLKPPANLLVLEGDCLDASGDASELESYLLSTCDFFSDFLLLDPCDAGAVYDFLKTNAAGKENIAPHRGSSIMSKTRRNILTSPTGGFGATAHRSSIGKNQGVNINQNMENNCAFEINNDNHWSGPHVETDHPDDDMSHVEKPNLGFSDVMDDSDDDNDDPWKPLNPHEPGNLKVKPFKKIKGFGRQVIHHARKNISTSQFPIAKLDGIISQEFAASFEVKLRLQERLHASQSPPLFEKLRRSLTFGEQETYDNFAGFEDENDDDGGQNHPLDFDQPDLDLPNTMCDMDTGVPFCHRKQSDDAATCDHVEGLTQDDLDSHATLEDLCRSHLDALLASIAETEKQTELATRVSTWKQQIEHTLEEQDAHPPFDIQLYGERIMDKLFLEVDSGGTMPFTDIVMGQPKHDVARTFSALLQLVNDGNVDLERAPASNEFMCHTAANPFYVRLLCDDRRRKGMENRSARKRVKSPVRKECTKSNSSTSGTTSPLKSLHQNGRFSLKLGKGSVIRCTPEGKRRRRSSRFIDQFDLQSAG